MSERTFKVKEVAEVSGVTVRTLHHYDAIGLLSPARRTSTGYRLYAEEDLLTLQQIVVHRELGLSLEQIRSVLSEPGFDRRAALLAQRDRLEQRAARTTAMIRAIDLALQQLEGELPMSAKDLFNGFDPAKYDRETEQRWGDTDAYRHSARRSKQYSPKDWARIKAESSALYEHIADLLESGTTPTSTKAMDLAEEHRLQIDRYFYPCSYAMHDCREHRWPPWDSPERPSSCPSSMEAEATKNRRSRASPRGRRCRGGSGSRCSRTPRPTCRRCRCRRTS